MDIAARLQTVTRSAQPMLAIRSAWVVSVQWETRTLTVQLQGDDTTTITEVRLLDDYTPEIGDMCWLIRLGSDLLAIGAQHPEASVDAPTYIATDAASGFQNSWVDFGSGYCPARYWKDPNGIVHLDGVIKSGTSATATMFTLPSGYRPAVAVNAPGVGNNLFASISIAASGDVNANAGGSTTYTSLCGISFPADDTQADFYSKRQFMIEQNWQRFASTGAFTRFAALVYNPFTGRVTATGRAAKSTTAVANETMLIGSDARMSPSRDGHYVTNGNSAYAQILVRPGPAIKWIAGSTTFLALDSASWLPYNHEARWLADLTYANSWVDGSNEFQVGYTKDAYNIVHLRGNMTTGTTTANTTMATIPAGYRPGFQMIYPAAANGAFGAIDVTAGGLIQTRVASATYTALNNARWLAEA